MSNPIRTLNDALRRNAATIPSHPALVLLEGESGLDPASPDPASPDPASPDPASPHLANADSRATALGTTVCWSRLNEWANRLAHTLRAQSQDRPVVHRTHNTANDVLVALACQAGGIVEVPVDSEGGETYLRRCRDRIGGLWLDDDQKRDLVAASFQNALKNQERARTVDATFSAHASAQQDALVLWTSGTSGDPKGVVLTHHSLLRNAQAKLRAVPQSRSDRRLSVLSVAHAYARTCDLGTWILSGCTLAITRGFDGWANYASGFEPTLCNMVPSLAARVLDRGPVPPSLRLLGCGGAAMTVGRFAQWSDRNVTVIQGYGLTEAGPVIASQTPEDSVAGYVGRLVEGWDYRIERGRLLVRGEHQMRCYWDDAAATAMRIGSAGWLDTGDLVEKCDITGQLKILGRVDDRIVLDNGHKVDPHGIELRLAALDGIRAAVVMPSPDNQTVELWIESDAAVDSMPDVAAIIETLPGWERPKTIGSFSVPESLRDRLLNRKGAIRRTQMQRYLRESTGS